MQYKWTTHLVRRSAKCGLTFHTRDNAFFIWMVDFKWDPFQQMFFFKEIIIWKPTHEKI